MAHLLIIALLLSFARPLGVEAHDVLAPDAVDTKPLMRQHKEISAVQISAAGEVKQVGDVKQVKKRSCDGDYNCESYILGTPGTNNCADPTLHSLISTREHCKDAAKQAGALNGTLNGTVKVLLLDDQQEYPMGCFKGDNNTFFFNPAGSPPTKPETHGATPVCRRNRNMNGTADNNAECPASYSRVLDADTCKTIAECAGYCHSKNNLFYVGTSVPAEAVTDPRPAWSSKYNEMPKGCFVHSDGCLYYNVPEDAEPTSPKGIPPCNITAFE